MIRNRTELLVVFAAVACADSAQIPLSPPPGPAPTLATAAFAMGGTRVQGFAGSALPDEAATLIVSGTSATSESWTATSRRGRATFDTPFGEGSGVLRWTRSAAPQGAGMHVDTIVVALTAHPDVVARFVDTVEVLPPPSALTMLVSPRSRVVQIVFGDDAPDGSATVSLAPAATDGGAWCVSPSSGITLSPPLAAEPCTATASGGAVHWERQVAGRGPGVHVDTIRIWRNGAFGSPTMVVDTLVILPGPGPFTFALSDSTRADTLAEGGAATEDVVTVHLEGKGAAATPWTALAEGAPTWLSVITGVGEGPGQLRWRRDPAGLAPGTYAASLTVRLAGGGDQAISIADTLVVKGSDPGGNFQSPAVLWSGNEFRITSDAFVGRGHGAMLVLGSLRLPLVRHDDTTLTAALPDSTPGGAVIPLLLLDGYRVPLASLTVHGFTASRQWDRIIPTDAYAWPRDGSASVLGQTTEGLAVFDLDAGTSRVLAMPSTVNIRGPGATPDPDVFIIRNGPRVQSWRLRPVPTLVEVFDDFYNGVTRQMMQMSANAMFIAPGQHFYQRYTRPSANAPFTLVTNEFEQAEEVEGVYVSPRGDRATVRVDQVTLGVPVFDAHTAAVAYRAPLRGSHGVDWSPDGSRLVMAGRAVESPYPPHLVVLDAATGSVLQEKAFTQPIAAVASDDVRPFLYVVLEDATRGLSLLVLDKANLEVVATMRPSAPTTAETGCCYRAVIAPSRTSNTVHVFWWRYSWEFALPAP